MEVVANRLERVAAAETPTWKHRTIAKSSFSWESPRDCVADSTSSAAVTVVVAEARVVAVAVEDRTSAVVAAAVA